MDLILLVMEIMLCPSLSPTTLNSLTRSKPCTDTKVGLSLLLTKEVMTPWTAMLLLHQMITEVSFHSSLPQNPPFLSIFFSFFNSWFQRLLRRFLWPGE